MTLPPDIVTDANNRDARIAELATGFALNELDDAQLHELHGYLVDPQLGRGAARTAWKTLHTVTDLRAEQARVWHDTLRSRLAANLESGGPTTVTNRLMARLGLRRGGLPPVTARHATYVPEAHSVWLRVGLAVGGLMIVAGAIAGYAWSRQAAVAHIDSVIGRAVIAGRASGPGDALDGQPLSVADEAQVSVRWPDGTLLKLIGPGTLIPQQNSVAVLGGTAWIQVAGTFGIGLPDRRVRASTAARLVVEVAGERSCLSIARGPVVDAAEQPLSAQTCLIGDHSFAWSQQTWAALPEVVPLPGAARWQLTATTLADATGSLTMTWAGGSVISGPDGIALLRSDGSTVRAVRPPAGRRFDLEATPWAFTVRVQDDVWLETAVPPTTLRCRTSGAVPLTATFRSGPPLTDVDVDK